MVESVKQLPCKHKNLNLFPDTTGIVTHTCNQGSAATATGRFLGFADHALFRQMKALSQRRQRTFLRIAPECAL